MNRYVSITTYAKIVGINRESVYKRIKRGSAVLLKDCDVPVVDLSLSKGTMKRNDWSKVKQPDLPSWAHWMANLDAGL